MIFVWFVWFAVNSASLRFTPVRTFEQSHNKWSKTTCDSLADL
jgi:hypothetical protein